MKAFSAFVLLLLASVNEGKPLQRNKRTILKDYFNPLTYPTVNLQFERGEDGKYHEKVPGDSINSKVEYALAQGIDASNEISGDISQSLEGTIKVGDSANTNPENVAVNPVSSSVSKSDYTQKDIDISAKDIEKDKIEAKEANHKKLIIPEITSKLYSETKPEEVANKKHKISAKLDIPIDSKWSLVPKPDGKDDKTFEDGEEFVPKPPIGPEEKDSDEKVGIGQIPKHHPVFVPPNIPVLIPKRVSFRILTLLPKQPGIDISDRLPLPKPEVFEESSETAVVEKISPSGPIVVKEGKRLMANHFVHPLRFGMQLPFWPNTKVIKEAAEEEKVKGVSKSEIVNIGGRKMLLQRKVLISPHHDPSRMHINFMSIQPLEDVDPEILKEFYEKKKFESEEVHLDKDLKLNEKEEREKRFLRDEKSDAVVTEKGKKGKGMYSKHIPHPETLDTKKTEVIEKKSIDDDIPTFEFFVPVNPAVDMAVEDMEKEGNEEGTKEFELETNLKEENMEKAKEIDAAKESGLKTEIQTESKLDGNLEKDETKEILSDVSKEKEEENSTTVEKAEKDLLIGTEDLIKFRNQVKNLDTSSIDYSKASTGMDLMTTEFAFEQESQTKDEEAAQSKKIEVVVKPEESKFSLANEGKTVDEELINEEEFTGPRSGAEFTISKDSATDLLKAEKVSTESEKDDGIDKSVEDSFVSGSVTEKTTIEYDKEKTDKMNIESRDLQKEYKTKGKKGDDGILSSKDAVYSIATEIFASKDAREKTDIRNARPSDENSSKAEVFDLMKTEGAISDERKKKFEERKEKDSSKKKCKFEDSDESDDDSDDEDDLD